MSGCDREERSWLESRRHMDTSWISFHVVFVKELVSVVEKELGQRERLNMEDLW